MCLILKFFDLIEGYADPNRLFYLRIDSIETQSWANIGLLRSEQQEILDLLLL